MSEPEITYVTDSQTSCSSEWEKAYLAFETRDEARRKILGRLRSFGAEAWDRDAPIVEIFCGSGYGLDALVEMGFTNVEGMDLSATLVERYQGPAHCLVGDCRNLPFETGSRQTIIVHGGLHHLETLEDVDQVLSEVSRALAPGGHFCAVEPWSTPFLRLVLRASRNPLLRRAWAKLDAFQTMVEHEQETYDRWLADPTRIEAQLRAHFQPIVFRPRWGSLVFVGEPTRQS